MGSCVPVVKQKHHAFIPTLIIIAILASCILWSLKDIYKLNKQSIDITRHTSVENKSDKKYKLVMYYSRSTNNLFWEIGLFQYYLQDHFEFVDFIERKKFPQGLLLITVENQSNFAFVHGLEHCKDPRVMDHLETYNASLLVYEYWNDNRKLEKTKYGYYPIYMPLFFRHDFSENMDYKQDIYPLIYEFDEKQSKYNERYYMIAMIHAVHLEVRRAYDFVYDDISRQTGKYNIFKHITKEWSIDNTEKDYMNAQEYKKTMLNSRFVSCPPGNNPETYRIFEAISCGAIPILFVQNLYYSGHRCHNAFNGFLFYDNPENRMIDDRFIYDFEKEGNWVPNERKYIFETLDPELLEELHQKNEFLPAIVMSSEIDLQPFLDFVYRKEQLNKSASDAFWNKFQFYAVEWLRNMIEYKMNQFETALLQSL